MGARVKLGKEAENRRTDAKAILVFRNRSAAPSSGMRRVMLTCFLQVIALLRFFGLFGSWLSACMVTMVSSRLRVSSFAIVANLPRQVRQEVKAVYLGIG